MSDSIPWREQILERPSASCVASAHTRPIERGHLVSRKIERCTCGSLYWNFSWTVDLTLLNNEQILEYFESTCVNRPSNADYYKNLDLAIVMYIEDALISINKYRNLKSGLSKYNKWLKNQMERFYAKNLPGISAEDPKRTPLLSDSQYRK